MRTGDCTTVPAPTHESSRGVPGAAIGTFFEALVYEATLA
jgi:hypothetical protein